MLRTLPAGQLPAADSRGAESLPAALLGVLLVSMLLASCGSGSPRPSTPPRHDTTAAELAATMNAALRAADSMTGRGTVRIDTGLGTRAYAFWFTTTSRGDLRLETELLMLKTVHPAGPAGGYKRSLLVYNAAEHRLVRRVWEPAVAQLPSGAIERPPPGSMAVPQSRWSVQTDVPSFAVTTSGTQELEGLHPLSPEFASSARAALDGEGDRPVAGGVVDGRRVWQTKVAIPWPSSRERLSAVALTVDQTSGLTTSATLFFAGGGRASIEYLDLDADVGVPAGAFDTSMPAGAAADRTDGAADPGGGFGVQQGCFRFVSLAEGETLAGVPALLPTFAFSGFSLSEVVVADTGSGSPSGTVPELWLVYRDGLESYRLRLQSAPFGPDPAWEKFAGLSVRKLDHGPFAGQPARTWVRGVPEGTFDFVGPGLFVEDGREVARFAGDLTPYEFWQAANSLQPR